MWRGRHGQRTSLDWCFDVPTALVDVDGAELVVRTVLQAKTLFTSEEGGSSHILENGE